jgi:hypothetical protein
MLKMKNITLEMERLRNLNSGLGQYCLRLSAALSSAEEGTGFHFRRLYATEN